MSGIEVATGTLMQGYRPKKSPTRYLVMPEGMDTYMADHITDLDKCACDAGRLGIVDIWQMKEYYRGKWYNIHELRE